MGGLSKNKQTRKNKIKKIISKNDDRRKEPVIKQKVELRLEKAKPVIKEAEQQHSSLFFSFNENLVPPYRVLVDTNFVNSALQNKVDIFKGMMDLLLAKCIPCVTDCVLAELEKMGSKYRMALQLARDPRMERLTCTHRGTYADDCLCERVHNHKCYIVATNDADLKKRIRKIPGVPIMYCKRGHFGIERLPGHMEHVPKSK
ncbi:unnamed protein product [Amoebophrya sp. A25]|nr:unnamed protein product [Amoebophrya sp. A25]|eukprot:GSA25T00002219001.1